ncbi:MAG: M13 family metallopeptidase [Fidelibacterota bacterium]
MRKDAITATLLLIVFLVSCTQKPQKVENSDTAKPSTTISYENGFDLSTMDASVKPGDDFFKYVNGTWLKTTEIPGDYPRWGSFIELREENKKRLREVFEKAETTDAKSGTPMQKIGDLYTMGMDLETINKLGYKPIAEDLNAIDAMKTQQDVEAKIAKMYTEGYSPLFGFGGSNDLENSNMIITWVTQGGLGLPDKDYYLEETGRAPKIRKEYLNHMTRMFQLIDYSEEDARAAAETIMAIETRLAKVSLARAEMRNPRVLLNKMDMGKFDNDICPQYNWQQFFTTVGMENPGTVNVFPNKFFNEVSAMISEVPVDDWKLYLKWELVNSSANYLSEDFVSQDFEFYNKFLNGQAEMSPRWKQVSGVVNGSLGELVGKIYVQEYFPPEAKARMMRLVTNLKDTYRERIKEVDWMSNETKEKALVKLESFGVKIGYPDEWKDYSALEIKKDSYFDNIRRVRRFNFENDLSKINKPKNPKEWHMFPQTVNAYYSPTSNEIVFPAAILQPPFFNMKADAPINYGAIGAVIGHEMTHGFDDQGRKFAANGNLEMWWTDDDSERFNTRAEVLLAQYREYPILDSLRLNTDLCAGENIADLGGITLAYLALQKELAENPSETIDGFTPKQRFFLGFAQVWRTKLRDEYLASKVKTDPHPPGFLRANGTVRNIDAFYDAFNINETDALYLAPEDRARIW